MNHLEPQDTFKTLVERLSRASVTKHFDAYDDVAWDHESSRIDPEDPRWERGRGDLLGETEWYRRQTQSTRARIGLHIVACQMKMGIEFENILSRGLLEFAATCPNGSAEFRYAYHEVIEEGQHSLMFQEFVNRSGFDAPGITGHMKWFARRVPPLGRSFPELFFIHVLAGEVPIDHVQRGELDARQAKCTRCCAGSCRSTSRKRRATCASLVAISRITCRDCRRCDSPSCEF